VLHGNRPDKASLHVSLATTRAELDAASRLVHDCYVHRGYRAPSPDGRHVSPHLAMPTTAIFVARADGAVVATVALVVDSELQLPCDALYGAELFALRAAGRRLAEVSALAVQEGWRDVGLGALRALVQVVGIYGRERAHVDDLCIAVHPRHAAFYERRLRFRRFGALRAYEAVNGAPAVGLRLDLSELERPLADGTFAGSVFSPEARARVRACLAHDLDRAVAARRLQNLQRVAAAGAVTAMEVC
jgi:hypothetical protein